MKLGFVSAILPELYLDQVLAFAAAEQFATVEVMCWPVCIEMEDDTFGKSLEGRQQALKVASRVLRPYFS